MLGQGVEQDLEGHLLLELGRPPRQHLDPLGQRRLPDRGQQVRLADPRFADDLQEPAGAHEHGWVVAHGVGGRHVRVHELDEPAGPVQRTAMVLESGQQADQGIVERRDGVRGPVLEGAEVDEQPDGGVVRPVVRAAQHLALENLEVGAQGRLFLDRLVLGVFVALDSRVHARIVHSDALRSSCRRRLRSMARSFRPSAAACRTILAIRPWASWAMRAFGLTSNGKTRRARRSKR